MIKLFCLQTCLIGFVQNLFEKLNKPNYSINLDIICSRNSLSDDVRDVISLCVWSYFLQFMLHLQLRFGAYQFPLY